MPEPGRVVGVDVARGVALVGMAAVHTMPAADPDRSASLAYLLASGRAAALFAVLAGVAVAIGTGGQAPVEGRQRRAARAGLWGRGAVLLGLGMLLGLADTPVLVILGYYALLLPLGGLFLGLRPRTLLALALGWAVVIPVLSHLVRPDDGGRVVGNPTPGDLARPVGLLRDLLLTGTYPVLPWLSYLLLGMAIGRLPLHRTRVAVALLAGGAALASLAAAGSEVLLHAGGGLARLAERTNAGSSPTPSSTELAAFEDRLRDAFRGTTPTDSADWLALAAPHSSTPFDLLHTMGTAALVLGVALLAVRVARPALLPLAAAGAMPLTLYSAHVLALATLPNRGGTVLLWHVLVGLSVATCWRLLVGRGPLERVTRGADRGLRRATLGWAAARP